MHNVYTSNGSSLERAHSHLVTFYRCALTLFWLIFYCYCRTLGNVRRKHYNVTINYHYYMSTRRGDEPVKLVTCVTTLVVWRLMIIAVLQRYVTRWWFHQISVFCYLSTSRLKLFLFNSTMSTIESKDNRIKVLHTTLYNTTIHPYAAHVLRHKSAVPATRLLLRLALRW